MKKYIYQRTISEDTAKFLDKIIPQIHPHAGEKSSRVINRICQYLKFSELPNYNREFAKFADALSPLSIKRHTVLSINPLDYLTMSFGNSWASCHTIDKTNKRGMPNSYEGQYSSGTMSYMLDPSSMVLYTVDAEYNGTDYWTQPKINRQMFHYGEEKLVQARLYPQDNDDCDDAYVPYRNIVQSIMSVIFDFPNLWTFKRGSSAASEYIITSGTHYADYEYFSSCSLSRIKGSENEHKFNVGATPICIHCGERHDCQENINCCNEVVYCEHCGRRITDPDNEYWVDNHYYCENCVTYCEECGYYELNENVTYVESVGHHVCRDCLDDRFYCCECCGEYYRDAHWIENENEYVCDDCLEQYYSQCDGCGEIFHNDSLKEHDGSYYCRHCYEEGNKDVSVYM